MPKLESQCDRPRDGPPWQLPMSITSIPHLGAKKKSVVPSAWHLPSVTVPGLTLSRCKSCLLTLICRRRSPPPPLLSSPPLAVENGSLGTASESTSRETTPETPSPRSSSSQVSPLRSPPPHPSSERSGVSNHGNSTASRAQRGRKPQTWHRRPSAQRQSRDSGALGQPHPKPRAAVEWSDKRGIVVPLRPRKHSNRHIYHGRVIARGLTYRGGGGSGRRHPIWRMENGERRGPARLVQRHRRSGDRGRCRLRAGHHDARARLALNRRRGEGMQVRGRGNTTDKERITSCLLPNRSGLPPSLRGRPQLARQQAGRRRLQQQPRCVW